MPQNHCAQSNADSDHSTDNIEEAISRIKIQDNPGSGNAGLYPDRPDEPDCAYYLRTGLCRYGSNCRFNHPAHAVQGAQFSGDLPERTGQPDCGTGTCKYGSTCKYHHPKDRRGAAPVSFNSYGLPMRQDEKSCPYYMRTGSCKFGVACKFHHPQPSSFGTALALTGPSVFGSMGSTMLPSSGLPYAPGLPAGSYPKVPYSFDSHLQGLQSYMPTLPPSQDVLSAQGWNTYMVYPMSTSSINLPERPDQPECRYFMNNGSCKYGADCKYHHPKERIIQFATNGLGPLQLPIRPGQPICSNYSMYGICRYGATCKYDHPFAGYYQYGFGVPALPILDAPLINYQRNLPADDSIEPSKSSKYSEQIPKYVDATKGDLGKDKKNSEVFATETGSPPVSSPPSSQTSHDQPC